MREYALPPNRVALFKRTPGLLKQLGALGGVRVSLRDGVLKIEADDGGKEWMAEHVVHALAAGFAPRVAFKLFDDAYFLEEIDVAQAMRGKDKLVERYKARVIGEGGKAKRTIEELTDAWLSIPDDRVFILGAFDDLRLAKEAVLRLLEGQTHASVYAFLEKEKKKRKYQLR